ncbi:sensor histidine kinase [Nocardioides sp. NPDC059952]|uniref:sensor histidine kinase n=1 Tax=Nocardioides sp. NPDC059952 TaxID=3347014 RepID=UPI00364B0796
MKTRAAALSGLLRSSSVQDAGLAALLLVGTWVGGGNATPAVGVCLVAVAVRRRWPIPALVAASLASVAQMALGTGPVAADLAVPIILYTIAAHRPIKVSLTLLVTVLAAATAWSTYVSTDGKTDGATPAVGGRTMQSSDTLEMFGPTAWGGVFLLGSVLVLAWAIGWGMQGRRAYLDQRAALAVAAERARITREVHDVVAHGLAVIVMQAQGGAAAFTKRPADTLAALDTIVSTGRASLADLRHVLSAPDETDGSLGPVVGLAQLPSLVDQVRQAGTPVQLRINGSPQPVPAGIDVSSYRIVQEALTNTMKHAGADASARVEVTYAADAMTLEVTDDGSGGSHSGGTGNGLRGMRERVSLLGGDLDAGPGQDGGYVVRARIPLAPGAAG